MNNREVNQIYNAYTNKEDEINIGDSNKQYLDDLVPLAKQWGVTGIKRYLNSQGVSDPEAIKYIQQKIH